MDWEPKTGTVAQTGNRDAASIDCDLPKRKKLAASPFRLLVNTVPDLTARGVGFKVPSGHGASIDTTSPSGKLVFGIFAALAEFERELIVERTKAGMAAARARGRNGGRPYTMTAAKLRLAMASMASRDAKVGVLCTELGVTRQTLYRHVDPKGNLRPDGQKLLKGQKWATRIGQIE